MSDSFDIVVVGAGHAGAEAAAAAARLGRTVACVTFDLQSIGRLSCNPAVGGLAKGQLVRELDALGGLMGRVTDASSIQFRQLNTRKGLAVRSSRAQVDVHRYPRAMAAQLRAIPGLTLVEAEATGFQISGGRVVGLQLAGGRCLRAGAVILTTGTFLGGLLHCGDQRTKGGRLGDRSASKLSQALRQLGLRMARLKTGTVPRLDGRTIQWHRLELQEDTVPEGRFSFAAHAPPKLPQIACRLTYTTPEVHELIRGALHRSPLYTGVIEGTGPRYCPSIEDKVVRFADRQRHLLFLEPEGLDTHRVYVNGLSTSLPGDVQRAMLRLTPGLEEAKVLQLGYAVEYDIVDPTQLGPDLQLREVPGLYLAGQVNGSSGYEEAAVQGFVAGVSAAQGAPFTLRRDEAYIGVLVDDLVTRGVGGEPYRMFTSRAEHRLLLREDNADRRLMPRGQALGLIDEDTWRAFGDRQDQARRLATQLPELVVNPTAALRADMERLGMGAFRRQLTAEQLLRRPEVSYSQLASLLGLPDVDPLVAQQLETDAKYAGYIARAEKRAAMARRLEEVRLPSTFDWASFTALSNEVRERLARHQPETLAQLSRVPGVTPAAVDVVAGWISRGQP